MGAITDQRHAFGDAALLEALLSEAGLQDIDIKTVARRIRFSDGMRFIRLNTMAFVGMSAAAKSMSDDERKRIIETIIEESAPV